MYTGSSSRISDDHYLVAGNNVKLDANFDSYNTRNIFVAAVDKSTSEVKTTYLTNYNEGEETTTTPQLVNLRKQIYGLMDKRRSGLLYICKQ